MRTAKKEIKLFYDRIEKRLNDLRYPCNLVWQGDSFFYCIHDYSLSVKLEIEENNNYQLVLSYPDHSAIYGEELNDLNFHV